eukprot:357274-Chlamydomonas_euryale.AAC.14
MGSQQVPAVFSETVAASVTLLLACMQEKPSRVAQNGRSGHVEWKEGTNSICPSMPFTTGQNMHCGGSPSGSSTTGIELLACMSAPSPSRSSSTVAPGPCATGGRRDMPCGRDDLSDGKRTPTTGGLLRVAAARRAVDKGRSVAASSDRALPQTDANTSNATRTRHSPARLRSRLEQQ